MEISKKFHENFQNLRDNFVHFKVTATYSVLEYFTAFVFSTKLPVDFDKNRHLQLGDRTFCHFINSNGKETAKDRNTPLRF